MYIFNQGKYKSLHAQEAGELAAIRQVVEQDQDFRPTYHLAPPTGLLNDPNGLIFDGEKYHIFYQWFPYDALHGMKHWKHLITTDFQNFTEADPLIPDEMFESHGCYSGGAILWQDQIVVFYTGNTRRSEDNQRIPHQNIAVFDKSGKLLNKRCIMTQSPEHYTEHVRDPKPFVTPEGKIRFVLGAQRENLTGTAILYEMAHLEDKPNLLGEIEVKAFDNQNVFMWECPDLFQLDGKDIFIWSPQGKQREVRRFQNNYHSVYAVGQLKETKLIPESIDELDNGFDFYAPQTMQNTQGILFGWVGLPDLTYPTDQYKWHSMLTMPRKLFLQQGKIYQYPIEQVIRQRSELQQMTVSGKLDLPHLDISYLKISPQNKDFSLDFFDNAQGQHLTLSYENNVLTLDRSATEQTELMLKFGSKRHCEIDNLEQIEIFFDRSVVEIFLNQGEKVMTSRFFIAQRQNVLTTSRELTIQFANMQEIKL